MRISIGMLIIFVCSAVQGQQDHQAGDAKKQPSQKDRDFKINRWPGKQGPLKGGFVFNLQDYSALNGFVAAEDDRLLKAAAGELPAHMCRTVTLVKNQGQPTEIGVHLEIRVLPTSTNDAHQALHNHFLSFQIGNLENALKFASEIGLELGDVGFIGEAVTLATVGSAGNIEFVRNNVVVILTRVTGEPGNSPDLSALAQEIDHKIKTQPDYTKNQLPSLFPVVSSFAPQVATIQPRSSTPVNLTATDPRGQKLEFQFDAGAGGLEGVGALPTVTYYSNERTGNFSLKCVCINEGLLFSVATSSITVQN